MPLADDIRGILEQEFAQFRLTAPAERLEQLADLLAWLAPAAAQVGLTNYRTTREYITNLAAPAFLFLEPRLRPYLLSPILDFGAGSGAIGLSLAVLFPDCKVVLADRRTRVLQFIDLAISRYHLANASTKLVNLAHPSPAERASVATVLVRAYGPTGQALEQALAWLQPGGTIALWHQPPAPPPPERTHIAHTRRTGVRALDLTIYSTAPT